jgi:hypothetical protein
MGLNLGKQIGPLPAGAWLGVVGGGLAIAYFINKKQAASDSSANAPASLVDPDSATGVGGGQFQYEPIQTVPAPDTDALPEDNVGWGNKASNWLVGQGFPAVTAQNAINKYLASMPLSTNERFMVDMAIAHFGVPPEPLSPTDDSPTAPTTPTVPATPAAKPPPVTGLTAHPLRRSVNFTWNYNGPPIGGFQMSIKDLRTGKWLLRNKLISAKSRSYRWAAPGSWNARNKGKVQIWIVPFKGGFTVKNKNYGDGRGASAAPII